MRELSLREKRSKVMFGSQYALDIYGVIVGYSTDPPEAFSAQDVHGQFFDSRTTRLQAIKTHLSKLAEAGLVKQVKQESDQVKEGSDENSNPLYEYNDSSFWQCVRDIVSEEIGHSLAEER